MKAEKKRCSKPRRKEERAKHLKRCRIFQGQAALLFGLSFRLGWMLGWPDGQVLDPLRTEAKGIDQNAYGADLVLLSRAANNPLNLMADPANILAMWPPSAVIWTDVVIPIRLT